MHFRHDKRGTYSISLYIPRHNLQQEGEYAMLRANQALSRLRLNTAFQGSLDSRSAMTKPRTSSQALFRHRSKTTLELRGSSVVARTQKRTAFMYRTAQHDHQALLTSTLRGMASILVCSLSIATMLTSTLL